MILPDHFIPLSQANLASILNGEEDCFVSSLLEERADFFWLGGRYIREIGIPGGSVGDRFIWTDGSQMKYTNWNKDSQPRNCSTGDCPYGEPQDSESNLCLHGGVNNIRLAGKRREGKGKGKAREPPKEMGKCYTWGNQRGCLEQLSFVCKRRLVPCLTTPPPPLPSFRAQILPTPSPPTF